MQRAEERGTRVPRPVELQRPRELLELRVVRRAQHGGDAGPDHRVQRAGAGPADAQPVSRLAVGARAPRVAQQVRPVHQEDEHVLARELLPRHTAELRQAGVHVEDARRQAPDEIEQGFGLVGGARLLLRQGEDLELVVGEGEEQLQGLLVRLVEGDDGFRLDRPHCGRAVVRLVLLVALVDGLHGGDHLARLVLQPYAEDGLHLAARLPVALAVEAFVLPDVRDVHRLPRERDLPDAALPELDRVARPGAPRARLAHEALTWLEHEEPDPVTVHHVLRRAHELGDGLVVLGLGEDALGELHHQALLLDDLRIGVDSVSPVAAAPHHRATRGRSGPIGAASNTHTNS
mmetsp:Transcript_4286/g.12075  ORF Transcript_4286/g.12075 Transcript_4286/m.12075 type:complete len:347 (+) Transcript_4286:2171-3211(+)